MSVMRVLAITRPQLMLNRFSGGGCSGEQRECKRVWIKGSEIPEKQILPYHMPLDNKKTRKLFQNAGLCTCQLCLNRRVPAAQLLPGGLWHSALSG